MKNFIKSIALFGLFAIVFYVVVLFLWGTYAPEMLKPNLNYRIGSSGHLYSRLEEVKKIKNVDVLFLGSSHAYRGFDPRVFEEYGFTSFNLGSSAQTPTQTKVLLQRYLDQLHPKIIVFEVSPTSFSIDGVESALDIIANDKNDRYSMQMAFELNNMKVYNTLIYGTLRDWFQLNASFKENIVKGSDTYIPGGFVQKELTFFEHQSYEKNEWKFNDEQFASFQEIVALLELKKIPFILVNQPITAGLYKSYSNNAVFDNSMKKYAEYYNFNEILKLDDSLHFYDSNHLNQNGVVVYDQKIAQILKKNIVH